MTLSSLRQRRRTSRPAATDAFLDTVAADTWRYISSDWARANHLPYSWRSQAIEGGAYANTTEIGLYLLSWLAAHDARRDWSPSRQETITEAIATLRQLEAWQTGSQAETNGPNAYRNSLFFQWYWIDQDPPAVGQREIDHLVPSIDNAFLAASLITAREYALAHQHMEMASLADGILGRMDFSLCYHCDRRQFRLGRPNDPCAGVWADYYSNENRLINVMARALGHVSPDEYRHGLQNLVRTPGIYRRKNPRDGEDILVAEVAWDGSYFTYTTPAMFIREADMPYGPNTLDPVTAAQIAYAQDCGYTAWGLSECYGIGCDRYYQQGALPVASGEPPETCPGLVSPHASALALITSYSRHAIANLQAIQRINPAVYRSGYGFCDAIMADPTHPDHGEVCARYSALGQEWLFLAIMNHDNGFIWDYFYRDQQVAEAHDEMVAAMARPQALAPAAS